MIGLTEKAAYSRPFASRFRISSQVLSIVGYLVADKVDALSVVAALSF